MIEYLYIAGALLCAAVLFAAGLPVSGPRPEGWLKAAVARDVRLLKALAWLLGAVVAAFALELLDGPGAWLLLAVVASASVPAAVDRWRRTNGRARRARTARS